MVQTGKSGIVQLRLPMQHLLEASLPTEVGLVE